MAAHTRATNGTSTNVYEGEGHGLRGPAHPRHSTKRTLAWFDKYLKVP